MQYITYKQRTQYLSTLYQILSAKAHELSVACRDADDTVESDEKLLELYEAVSKAKSDIDNHEHRLSGLICGYLINASDATITHVDGNLHNNALDNLKISFDNNSYKG